MRLSWQKSQKSDPVKALPMSVTILLGAPNRWVASFDVTVATTRTSIHLVNLSTATFSCACIYSYGYNLIYLKHIILCV
jgi:hypothetical protein